MEGEMNEYDSYKVSEPLEELSDDQISHVENQKLTFVLVEEGEHSDSEVADLPPGNVGGDTQNPQLSELGSSNVTHDIATARLFMPSSFENGSQPSDENKNSKRAKHSTQLCVDLNAYNQIARMPRLPQSEANAFHREADLNQSLLTSRGNTADVIDRIADINDQNNNSKPSPVTIVEPRRTKATPSISKKEKYSKRAKSSNTVSSHSLKSAMFHTRRLPAEKSISNELAPPQVSPSYCNPSQSPTRRQVHQPLPTSSVPEQVPMIELRQRGTDPSLPGASLNSPNSRATQAGTQPEDISDLEEQTHELKVPDFPSRNQSLGFKRDSFQVPRPCSHAATRWEGRHALEQLHSPLLGTIPFSISPGNASGPGVAPGIIPPGLRSPLAHPTTINSGVQLPKTGRIDPPRGISMQNVMQLGVLPSSPNQVAIPANMAYQASSHREPTLMTCLQQAPDVSFIQASPSMVPQTSNFLFPQPVFDFGASHDVFPCNITDEHASILVPNGDPTSLQSSMPFSGTPRTNHKAALSSAYHGQTNSEPIDVSCAYEALAHSDQDLNFAVEKCATSNVSRETKRKDSPVKRKTSKLGATESTEVDEIPEEEEDDGEDYVSQLNRIAQKHKSEIFTSESFSAVHTRSGGGAGWKCTTKATFRKTSPQEVIQCVTIARNKNRAKRAAAKDIMVLLRSKIQKTLDNGISGKNSALSASVKSAASVLHHLAQEGTLLCQTSYDLEEVNDSGDEHWLCTATVFTKEHGSKVFAEHGSSKNSAKQKVAGEALAFLIKLQIPGAVGYRSILEEPQLKLKKTMADLPDACEIIVRTTDEERSNGSAHEVGDDMDERLVLPRNYDLVIARSNAECERWFEKYSPPGTELGIFVDSPLARDAIDYSEENVPFEENFEEIRFPVICFSTLTAGIIVRIDKREDVGNGFDLSKYEAKFWIPEIVAAKLEDGKVHKVGLACEEGFDILSTQYGIEPASVSDIGVTSLAVAGLGKIHGCGHLSSLRDLTKYWIQKEASNISWYGIWPEKGSIPSASIGVDGNGIATALISAFAVRCVREKVSDAARRKRLQMHGASGDSKVLSSRVLATSMV